MKSGDPIAIIACVLLALAVLLELVHQVRRRVAKFTTVHGVQYALTLPRWVCWCLGLRR